MALSRARRVNRYKFLSSTLDSKVNRVYYVKNVYYGSYCDTYDYRTVKVSFKSNRGDYKKKKQSKKSDFSVYRARERVYRIVRANEERQKKSKRKSVFFTLTTKDQITSHKQSNAKIKGFIRRLNHYLGYKVKYIIVPELHKSNAIHYHGVFFNLPFIPVRVFSRDIWTHGYTDIQLPRKIRNVASYISKYLTKDFQANTPKNTKTYFCSRGLKLPQEDFTDRYPEDILSTDEVSIHQQYLKIKHTIKDAKNSNVCFS